MIAPLKNALKCEDFMTQDDATKDQLFAQPALPGDFVFDENVARVFEDMINRSVPGYSTILAMIGVMAERYCQNGSRVYDLGCSLGGASFAVVKAVPDRDYSVVAIDNSEAMIARLQNKIAEEGSIVPIQCRCENILESEIAIASMVILNFTLQFLPPQQRDRVLKKIYQGLKPGGLLIISEKIRLPDTALDELLVDLYHDFKQSMGYSELEIAQKRAALEKVLLPETLGTHRSRLQRAGFQSFDVWFQCFNFASIVAFK